MSNNKKKLAEIDRRSFLTGSFNTLLGLPVLDFMLNSSGTAFAQNVSFPKRFIMMTNGNALRADKVNPLKSGRNYDLPHALKVLENYPGLRDKFSIVSNLGMPYWRATKVKTGPGLSNKREAFHLESMVVQMTGKKAGGSHKGTGPSFDRLLSKYFNVESSHENFYASVCLSQYGGNNKLDSRAVHQFGKGGARAYPEQSIMNYYNKLTQKVKSADPAIEKARIDALKNKKSVIDFVEKRKLAYLNKLVSNESKQKISDHLDHVRTIENSIIKDLESGPSDNSCQKMNRPSPYDKVDNVNDYSSEYERSLIFVEMMTMAIRCDLTRFGTLVITPTQSMINHKAIRTKYGVHTNDNKREQDYHGNTHNLSVEKQPDHNIWKEISATYRWHIDMQMRLAKNLQNSKEGAQSILDNSIVYLNSEGGWGPMTFGNGTGNPTGPHSCENMTQFYITGMKNLKQGEHIKLTKARHACEALLTAMRATGYKGNLGDVSKIVNEMVA